MSSTRAGCSRLAARVRGVPTLLAAMLVAAASVAPPGRASDAAPSGAPQTCRETASPGGTLTVTVDNTQGSSIGVLIVLVDYPESEVFIPGAADDADVQAAVSDRPTGSAQCLVNDRDTAIQVGCLSVGGFPDGRFFRVAFRDCAGGATPTLDSFRCTVVEAADKNGDKVPATCTLQLS